MARIDSRHQMAYVDRIKGPAKDPDALARRRP